MAQRSCVNCNRPLEEGDFCPHCGFQQPDAELYYTAPINAPGDPYTAPLVKPASKRVRKLPIVLTVLAIVGGILLLPEKEEPQATIPKPVSVPVFAVPQEDLLFSFQEEGLTVTVDHDGLLTVTAEGLELQDTYPVNLPESEVNRNEYNWRVECLTETDAIIIAVHHMKEEQEQPREIRIDQMQGSLYFRNNDFSGMGEGYYDTHADVEVSCEGDSITWKCVVPDKVPVVNKPISIDLSAMCAFEVSFSDFVNEVYWDKMYTVAE